MKKVILIVSIYLVSISIQAQKVAPARKSTNSKIVRNSFPVKGKLVTVNDWGGIGNLYIANYWISNKAAIVSQLGTKEFEQVKLNGDENKWPNVFKERLDANDKDITAEKFKDLKLYKIATFTNTINGKKFNEMVILRVSRSENAKVFSDSDWFSDIYFLLKASSVTEK